jgi:large subunit ribosomal protein L3
MNQNPGVIGKKLGFVPLFQADGSVARVTVIEAGPVVVAGKRTQAKDGYNALIFAFQDAKEKHLTAPVKGQFEKGLLAGTKAAPKRIIKELRCSEEFSNKFEVGATVKLDDVFQVGQLVDVQGRTRGRGFTGVMRRWNFAGFVRTHGTHEYRRHGGSIGTNMTPGRTLPNIKMGGHYGDETVSVLNLKVVQIDNEKNLIMVDGGVPGSKNGLVLVRHAVKKRIKRS